jgi:serine/threonine protein kinase
MEAAFQVDKFHFNNQLGSTLVADRYSGFSLEDQSQAVCYLFNEEILTPEQVEELQRVNVILAQQHNDAVLRPLSWGLVEGRHYLVLPDLGRPLSSYEHLKPLPPSELLMVLRRLLRALCFAEGKGIGCHQSIRPENVWISLEKSEVKLGFFGYPSIAVARDYASNEEAAQLAEYFPPPAVRDVEERPQQYDLYALGLIGLELATARRALELLAEEDRMDPVRLRAKIDEQQHLPLPVKELLFKMLTPVQDSRYQTYQQALDDVVQLAGKEETGLSFQTFILDTLINGRFKLHEEIAKGRVSRVFSATDIRAENGEKGCVVKLIDLRSHPEMGEVFHTRFKQLTAVRHEHLMAVYDVGIHFENGYVAMESGLQSLEQLLIKRGTLPLTDAGRILFQLCKALEGLHFHQINYHGAIKPSNVFLSSDLRTIKLGDTLIADYFLRNGNLNFISAEYYNPEFIRGQECDVRSDIYSMGLLFFEMLVGHPPFSFKIEQELVDDHLHLAAGTRVEPALISNEVKDMILRMLEKNPTLRYGGYNDLRDELTILLGYDKKEQVEIPHLFFDFSELSMVGKNAREKCEETLAIRLPAVGNRARGALALLVGHGPEVGDASKAATSALKNLRELLFNPGSISAELAKTQKTDPESYLGAVMLELNQRLYRDAFASGKTKRYGLSAVIGIVQENTLFMHQIGDVHYQFFAQGRVLDQEEDKWTLSDDITLGNLETALSDEVHSRLGFGEMIQLKRMKRRLKDGDQMVLLSDSLFHALSISEVRELVTSSGETTQAIEMIRSDAIRRRLEGTISCVLLSIGNVTAFAEENISHAKKGMLARNFLAQGDSYLQDGRIDEAIEQYTQALEINPNFAIIHHQLGSAYIRKGLSSYAQSCFERAIQLNSKLGASYVEIAKLLRHQRREREILPLLRKSVSDGCRDTELFALLGHELLRVRNFDEAILYCTYALDVNPAHPTAYRDRLSAIRRRGAIDTKLLKMFSSRPRLADDGKTRIEQEVKAEREED